MSKPAIRIEAVPVEDLEAFAQRAQREPGILPITPRRARAYATNPNAVPDEIALLVAYDADRCIGYLGIMAGILRANGEVQRIHWFSTWYVDPAHAKSGAGTMLLMRAIGLKYDLAVTGTSPEADEMYRAMRFKEIGPLKYEEIFLDALDPLGFPFFAIGKWLEKRGKTPTTFYGIADTLRPIAQPILKRIGYAIARQRSGPDITTSDTKTYDDKNDSASTPHFFRDTATANWMIDNPWFTEDKSDAVDGYYFGDCRPLFRYHIVNLERDDEVVGSVIVSASRKLDRTTVKVLDYWIDRDETRADIISHVFEVASKHNADRILFPTEFGSDLRRIALFGRLTFTRSRNYFCRPKKKDSALTPVLDQIELQLTDGDCAFS
jgi:GNAT superfamily N-acetyltransferase